jgi:hypothetical protein
LYFYLEETKRKFVSKSEMAFVLFRFLYGPGRRFVLTSLKTPEQRPIFPLFILINIEPDPVGEFLGKEGRKGQKVVDVVVFFMAAARAFYIDTFVRGHVELTPFAEYFDYRPISWLCHVV